jgi:hypothetical protein
MNTRAIVAALLLLLIMPNELAYGQATGCPEEGNDRARAQVMSMLDDRQDILQRDGIDVSSSELRLMTNNQDPDACAELVRLDERPGDDPLGPASGSISVYDADHDIVALYF